MQGLAQLEPPDGGMFLWVRLPEGMSAIELLPKGGGAQRGLCARRRLYADNADQRTLRLSFDVDGRADRHRHRRAGCCHPDTQGLIQHAEALGSPVVHQCAQGGVGCARAGLPLQRTDAGGQFGLVREAAYLQRNPNGLVPLMEDDDTGLVLWESNAIVRYLCARHSAGKLLPEELPARFVAEQWMDWQQTTLNPAGRDAFIQWMRTPAAQRNSALISASVAATEPPAGPAGAAPGPLALHGG